LLRRSPSSAANIAKADAAAARYVHWGATSQDVIDTGAMLGLRAGIDALLADIGRAMKDGGVAWIERALAREPRSDARFAAMETEGWQG